MSRLMSRREFLGAGAAFATVVSLAGCSSADDMTAVTLYASPPPDIRDDSNQSSDPVPQAIDGSDSASSAAESGD